MPPALVHCCVPVIWCWEWDDQLRAPKKNSNSNRTINYPSSTPNEQRIATTWSNSGHLLLVDWKAARLLDGWVADSRQLRGAGSYEEKRQPAGLNTPFLQRWKYGEIHRRNTIAHKYGQQRAGWRLRFTGFHRTTIRHQRGVAGSRKPTILHLTLLLL